MTVTADGEQIYITRAIVYVMFSGSRLAEVTIVRGVKFERSRALSRAIESLLPRVLPLFASGNVRESNLGWRPAINSKYTACIRVSMNIGFRFIEGTFMREIRSVSIIQWVKCN